LNLGVLPDAVPGRSPRFLGVFMRNVRSLGLLAGLSALAGSSFAAVPAAYTTAITDATTDGAAMAGSLLGVAAAIVVVMIALKFVKRIKGAV